MSELAALFLVERLSSASARTRALDLVGPLASRGVRAEVRAIGRDARSFLGGLAASRARRALADRAAAADVVVLARKLLPEGDLAALRRAARALVFDLDDALFARPSDACRRGPSFTRPRRFDDALRSADVVVAGNAWLREAVRARGHPRVRVLPPAVELPPSVPPSRSTGDGVSGDPVVLAWTGSRATLGYLERLAPVLSALARRRPLARLHVLADAIPAPLGIETRTALWSLEEEARSLALADVGIMPLDQDAWSHGKCGLKLVRYLASGLPVVTSRQGAGAELLDPPGPGFVADGEGEWLSSLEALVAGADLRRSLGARGRALAASRLSLGARAVSWAAVLVEAAAIGAARAARLHARPPRVTIMDVTP